MRAAIDAARQSVKFNFIRRNAAGERFKLRRIRRCAIALRLAPSGFNHSLPRTISAEARFTPALALRDHREEIGRSLMHISAIKRGEFAIPAPAAKYGV